MPRAASRVAELTVPYCKALKAEASRYRVTDAGQRSLKLVVEPSGRKYWSTRYVTADGVMSEAVLGVWPEVLLDEARRRANAKRNLVSDGKDPAQLKREKRAEGVERRAQTFAWLSEFYVKAAETGAISGKYGKKAASTLAKERHYLKKHVLPRLGNKPLADIRRAMVVAALEEIAATSGYAASNSSLEVIRLVFTYGRRRELVESNPALEIPSHKLLPRDVVASDDAIRQLWLALEASKADRVLKSGDARPSETWGTAAALQLALLTLQRRGEVVRIRKADVDFERALWTIPSLNKKERRKGAVPLSPWALQILREAFERSGGEWAFPSAVGKRTKKPAAPHLDPHTLTRFMARLRDGGSGGSEAEKEARRATLHDITPHDLRRTGRTKLTGEELQIDEVTAERVLNHSVGTRQQSVYDWNAYVGPKRAALEAWAAELRRIVSGDEPATTVTPLRRRRAALRL